MIGYRVEQPRNASETFQLTSGDDMTGHFDYVARASLYRPTDEHVLRAAAVELRSRGLTARDIGQALGLAPEVVACLLRTDPR